MPDNNLTDNENNEEMNVENSTSGCKGVTGAGNPCRNTVNCHHHKADNMTETKKEEKMETPDRAERFVESMLSFKDKKDLSVAFFIEEQGLTKIWFPADSRKKREEKLVRMGFEMPIQFEQQEGELFIKLVFSKNLLKHAMEWKNRCVEMHRSESKLVVLCLVSNEWRGEVNKFHTTKGVKGNKRMSSLTHTSAYQFVINRDDMKLKEVEDNTPKAEVDGDFIVRRSWIENLILAKYGESMLEEFKEEGYVLGSFILSYFKEIPQLLKGHGIVMDDEFMPEDVNIVAWNGHNIKSDFGLKVEDVAVLSFVVDHQYGRARAGAQMEAVMDRALLQAEYGGMTYHEFSLQTDLGNALARMYAGKMAWTKGDSNEEKATTPVNSYREAAERVINAHGSLLVSGHMMQHSIGMEAMNMGPNGSFIDGWDILKSSKKGMRNKQSTNMPAAFRTSYRSAKFLSLMGMKVPSNKVILTAWGVVYGDDIIGDAMFRGGGADLDDHGLFVHVTFKCDFFMGGRTYKAKDERGAQKHYFLVLRTPSNCLVGLHTPTGRQNVVGHEYDVVEIYMGDKETRNRLRRFGDAVNIDPTLLPANVSDIMPCAAMRDGSALDSMLANKTDDQEQFFADLDFAEENSRTFGKFSIAMTSLAIVAELFFDGQLPVDFESLINTEFAIDSWTNGVNEGIAMVADECERVKGVLIDIFENHMPDGMGVDPYILLRLSLLDQDSKTFPVINVEMKNWTISERIMRRQKYAEAFQEKAQEFAQVHYSVLNDLSKRLGDEKGKVAKFLKGKYTAPSGAWSNQGEVAGEMFVKSMAENMTPDRAYKMWLAQSLDAERRDMPFGKAMTMKYSNMMYSTPCAGFMSFHLSEWEADNETDLTAVVMDGVNSKLLKDMFSDISEDSPVARKVTAEKVLAYMGHRHVKYEDMPALFAAELEGWQVLAMKDIYEDSDLEEEDHQFYADDEDYHGFIMEDEEV